MIGVLREKNVTEISRYKMIEWIFLKYGVILRYEERKRKYNEGMDHW